MKAKTIAFVILAGLLTLFTTPVYAQEDITPLPHAFYGTVEVNGSLAPAGTYVEARGEGVQIDVGNNPVVITVEGRYGSSEPLEPKLIVQGDIAEGSTVTFYVNGVSTGQTTEWHSGGVTELNLAVTIEGPPPETTETPPPETTLEPAPGPAAFSLSSLTISPSEIVLGESVTISVEVTNTGEEAGNYEVILKIDGVVEASEEVSVAAGASQQVIFTVSKDVAKTYSVDINGLSGIFVVDEGAPALPAPPAPPAPPASPSPTAPAKAINWPVLWGVIGGMTAVGVTTFVLARRRARRKVY